jgi:long-chain acyl-CoA synthetase
MADSVPTIAELLKRWESEKPEALAILLPQAEAVREVTWREFARDVRRVAAAWQRWGLRPGERVAQISRNCYEWILNDFALSILGAVHVVLSEKTAVTEASRQLEDTAPRAFLVYAAEQWPQLLTNSPELAGTVCLAYQSHINEDNTRVQAWSAWFDANTANESEWHMPAASPHAPATIVYSSGTTSEPVGVILSQRHLLSNAAALATAFADEPVGRRLCWLPLAHLYARTADLYCWLVRGSELVLVEQPEDVLAAAQKTSPEFLNVVPYFLDKLRRHVQSLPLSESERTAKLQELLGGKVRLMISGGAPLAESLRQFYAAHGITVAQGYGLTEAGPVVATETLHQQRAGSVGRLLPGVEVQFSDSGEILVRSPSLMAGYWQEPKLTNEKLRDGWLHTGDLGHLDDDGYLFIDGRADDVIVLSTGCKISPAAIELALHDEPLIQQIIVVGHGRKHLAALIVPNPDALRAEIIGRAIPVASREQALVHPAVLELYRERIASRLQTRPPQEQLREISLIGRGWTIESGEMTPSLKLKRGIIQQNFAAEIERLYAGT